MKGYEKALGPDHMKTLQIVKNLGYFYAKKGKLLEAKEMYKRALNGREKKLGPDHTSTLQTFNRLSSLYKGKLKEAEEMNQRIYHSIFVVIEKKEI